MAEALIADSKEMDATVGVPCFLLGLSAKLGMRKRSDNLTELILRGFAGADLLQKGAQLRGLLHSQQQERCTRAANSHAQGWAQNTLSEQ